MDAFIPLAKLFRPEAAWFVRQREIISEPPERVWRAVTDPAELAQWWCERAEVDLRVGGWLAFGGRFVYGDDPGLKREDFQVLEVEEHSRLEFRWPLRGLETRVLIEIAPLMEESEIVVTQTADRAPPWAPPEGSHQWWSVALPGLRAYLERGRADLRPDYPALRAALEPSFQVEISTFPWMVWRKLTEPAELKRWIARDPKVDLQPGGTYQLGPGPGPRRLLEVEPEKLLVMDWHEEGQEGRVSWRIEEGEEATQVILTDHGPHPAGEDQEARDRRLFRWLGTVLHLKQLAERGITPREYQEG
jgi:uncharacterized protein YndB with AHSA1/START domain